VNQNRASLQQKNDDLVKFHYATPDPVPVRDRYALKTKETPGPAKRNIVDQFYYVILLVCQWPLQEARVSMQATRDRYLIKSIVNAAQLLGAFSSQGELLRLKQIVERSGINKTKAFRLLYSLERCGFVERAEDRYYRVLSKPPTAKMFRIGYAWPGEDYLFARDVIESVQRAAEAAGVELILADNRYNPKTALRNVDMFIRRGIDLAMEFQADERIASIISTKYHEAGIPMIAVEIPHPGATFYGANNYEAGLIAGRYVARWARKCWFEAIEEIIMLDLPRAGAVPATRITGMIAGIKEVLRYAETIPVIHLNGDGKFGDSFEAVRRRLRISRSKHTLVGAINDTSALGALRGFEEAGRSQQCAVVGQNASLEARIELRKPSSSLVGSVSYFPERYGEELIPLALDILNRRHVPPAVFIKHRMIDASNVDHFYPNDLLRMTN
jgi:ribose transport system substrate-binding protein